MANRGKNKYWLSKDDLFDDCAVCRAEQFAMEQGRHPTMTELLEAFKKAKDQGAIVGTDLPTSKR